MSWSPRQPERKKGRLRGFMLTEDSWNQALKDHQKRMHGVKPTIDFAKMPWGFDRDGACGHRLSRLPHRPASARNGKPSSRPGTARQASRSPPRGGAQEETPAGRDGRGAAATTRTPAGGAVGEFGVRDLSQRQQQICRDMTQLLVSLKSSAHSKRVVEEIFVNAEETRLLQGYTGVFPGLESATPQKKGAAERGRSEEDDTATGSAADSSRRHSHDRSEEEEREEAGRDHHRGGGGEDDDYRDDDY